MAVFFLHALTSGTLFPRIPDIQAGLGLSAGQLGLLLAGQPMGALLSILFASWLIERFGPKTIIVIALPGIALSTVLLALAPGIEAGFVFMAGFGITFAATNMSMNVEADRIEAATGRRLMNRCHGIWALGMLVSTSLGAALIGFEVPVLTHFLAVFAVVVVSSLIVSLYMRASPARAHAQASTRKKVIALPTRNTLLLSGLILAGVVPDAAIRAWSIIFMRDVFSVPDWVDSLTLPTFVLMLAFGRMVGDSIVTRFGAVQSARVLILVALAGLLLVVWAPGLYVTFAGFGLMGLGISILFPLVMSAGARLGDRPASENVTAIALVNTFINLGTPALIGLLAESYGIRAAFGLIVPVLLLAFVLTPRLAAGDED